MIHNGKGDDSIAGEPDDWVDGGDGDCFLNFETSSVEEALFVIGAFMRAQGREITAAEARELRLLLQGDGRE